MDILVISNYYKSLEETSKDDRIKIIKVGGNPLRDYTDFHAIVIDSRKFEDDWYGFEDKVPWDKIASILKCGATIIVLVSLHSFHNDYFKIPISNDLKVIFKLQLGQNLIRDLKQGNYLNDYAKRVENYFGIIENSNYSDGSKMKIITPVSENRMVAYSIEPLAITEMTKKLIGGMINVGEGKLLILPALKIGNDFKIIYDLIKKTEKSPESKSLSEPIWVNSIYVSNECDLKENLNILANNLNEIKSQITKISFFKSVLYLKHDELIDPILAIFSHLDISSFREEKYEEDFFICDDNNEKIIICEVKGTKNNIARKYVNNLDNHRDMNGLPADFPALLIVNTFAEANSLKEKDLPISPDIIKHAVNNNVIVMRTLDLLNVINLIEANQLTKEDFLNLIKEKAGWIKVNSNNFEMITK